MLTEKMMWSKQQ